MKRQGIVLLAMLLLAGLSCAQDSGPHEAHNVILWKTANFLLLAIALGYLVRKIGGPFLAARSAEIHRGIDEAARLKKEAEARLTEIEQRREQLGAEIDRLRRQASQEAAAEAERQRQETGRLLDKIRAQAEQDIAAAAKASRQQLRAYAADLAVNLAAQRIRDQLTPDSEAALISAALHDLESRGDREAARV